MENLSRSSTLNHTHSTAQRITSHHTTPLRTKIVSFMRPDQISQASREQQRHSLFALAADLTADTGGDNEGDASPTFLTLSLPCHKPCTLSSLSLSTLDTKSLSPLLPWISKPHSLTHSLSHTLFRSFFCIKERGEETVQ